MTKLLKLVGGSDRFEFTEEKVFVRGGAPVEVTVAEAEQLLTFPHHSFEEVPVTAETKEAAKNAAAAPEFVPVKYEP